MRRNRDHGGVLNRRVAQALVAVLALNPGAAWAASGASRALPSSSAAPSAALVVQSDPAGANVYVDGQLAGHTPLEVGRLTPGDHRVRVAKDGYLDNARVVTVGRGAKTVQVKLTPNTGSTATSAAQVTGGGGGGGGSKKWLWIAIAGGGGGGAAFYALTRNSPPIAGSVVASPATGLASSTSIAFTAQGASDPDGDPLTYTWDFGDGSSGSGERVNKTYANAGTFTATVTVSDGKKSATASGSVTIRSMTGTWTGNWASFNFTVNVTQTGASFTGTYVDRDGPGTVSGTVAAGNIVRFSVNQFPFAPFSFAGTANAAVSSVSGTVEGLFPFSMSR